MPSCGLETPLYVTTLERPAPCVMRTVPNWAVHAFPFSLSFSPPLSDGRTRRWVFFFLSFPLLSPQGMHARMHQYQSVAQSQAYGSRARPSLADPASPDGSAHPALPYSQVDRRVRTRGCGSSPNYPLFLVSSSILRPHCYPHPARKRG